MLNTKYLKIIGWIALTVAFIFIIAKSNQMDKEAALDVEPPMGSRQYVLVPRVLMQVCVPNQTVSYENVEIDLSNPPTEVPKSKIENYFNDINTIETAKKIIFQARPSDVKSPQLGFGQVLIRQGSFSDSMEHAYLYGDSTSNQPVYETMLYMQRNILNIHIYSFPKTNSDHEYVEFWFQLPPKINDQVFTSWQEPMSQVSSTFKTHPGVPLFKPPKEGGVVFPIIKPNHDAIKVRFKIMNYEDYGAKESYWNRTQSRLFDKYSKNLNDEEKNNLWFVPKTETAEIIPGC